MGDYYTKVEMDGRYERLGSQGVAVLDEGDEEVLVDTGLDRSGVAFLTVACPSATAELVQAFLVGMGVGFLRVGFSAPIPSAGYRLMWSME